MEFKEIQQNTISETRIDEFIEALMKVARGDYSVQVELTGDNDYLDALAIGINTMVDDVRLSKEVELENEKIKQLNIELKRAKEIAEESNRLKSAFISNLSHEIRTPMNGIIGFASLLNEPDISLENRQNFVRIITNSSNELLRIIDDILEISRLETKQVKVIEEKVNLNQLVLELFNVFNLRAKESKTPIYLKKNLSDSESDIYTDKSKLNKILSNLLENAMKFTKDGQIDFGYKKEEDKIVFFVKDTGVGIGLEKQHLIFERFSQEENSLSRNNTGLGLGLAIANENAELLGGNITLVSKIGKGSEFYVTIPYSPVNNIEKSENDKKEFKVLIVEDEEVNFLFLETLLSRYEYKIKIFHAANGKVAFDFCKENSFLDLILMDLKMPVMDGFESTKLIREYNPSIPIIAQSAYTSESDVEKAISVGCKEFIYKPIEKDVLFNVLKKYLVHS